jgi:hypothetical protein
MGDSMEDRRVNYRVIGLCAFSFLLAAVLALACSSAPAFASSKTHLSSTKTTLLQTTSKTITIKGSKKNIKKIKKASWKVEKGKSIISLSKKKKTSVKVTAKKAGKATLAVKVNGKKTYRCSVSVKSNSITARVGDTVTIDPVGASKNDWITCTVSGDSTLNRQSVSAGKTTYTAVNSGSSKVKASFGKKSETYYVKVKERYSYSLTPLIKPFNTYYYLKTDDPNPFDLRFTNSTGSLAPSTTIFNDVGYQDAAFAHVKGGYLFKAESSDFKGGKLRMERVLNGTRPYNLSAAQIAEGDYVSGRSGNTAYLWQGAGGGVSFASRVGDYCNTAQSLSVPAAKGYVQYLVDTCTSPSNDLFTNLDAVQKELNAYAIYPIGEYDSNKPTANSPYPGLRCTSAHEYGYLSPYCHQYESGATLARALYPYVLDSLGFPGTMQKVAKKLDPSCTVTQGSAHSRVDVTSNGQTRSYGGAGAGDPSKPFYSADITKRYTFTGGSGDLASCSTLDSVHSLLASYNTSAAKRAEEYQKAVSHDQIGTVIGNGTWLRCYGGAYSYMTRYCYNGDCIDLYNTWVDGRYLDGFCRFKKGEKWEDHPMANIVLRNQTYTTQNGNVRTADLYFTYDASTKTWRAPYAYQETSGSYSNNVTLPDEFVLTEDEVKNLNLDANTNTDPSSGYIYDTKSEPGTPFGN